MNRPVYAATALQALIGLCLAVLPWSANADIQSSAPGSGVTLTPLQLGVVINTADPLSVAIGNYYVRARHIPQHNVARVTFDYHRSVLSTREFTSLKAAIDAQLPSSVQAYALTWERPYRVECMSITSAFAFGFDSRYCARGCLATQLSPYFNSTSEAPYDELHIRPAMSLAASSFDQAKALIDRGVQSDGSAPTGTAYLVISGDAARDVRAASYRDAVMLAGRRIQITLAQTPGLEHRPDVMFYFIGTARVPGLDSNHFLPGAVADHLTSYGGALTDSSQMSSLSWLEAGATGSYGTVVEPCNFTAKFPNPPLLLRHYLAGETLIEAYWKSVAMPGQGIFIGEPLARPYRTSALPPGLSPKIHPPAASASIPFTILRSDGSTSAESLVIQLRQSHKEY
jgi:uncharacterized protein (TIGR03790 family)